MSGIKDGQTHSRTNRGSANIYREAEAVDDTNRLMIFQHSSVTVHYTHVFRVNNHGVLFLF